MHKLLRNVTYMSGRPCLLTYPAASSHMLASGLSDPSHSNPSSFVSTSMHVDPKESSRLLMRPHLTDVSHLASAS